MWSVFVLSLMWAPDVALFLAHQEDFVPVFRELASQIDHMVSRWAWAHPGVVGVLALKKKGMRSWILSQ